MVLSTVPAERCKNVSRTLPRPSIAGQWLCQVGEALSDPFRGAWVLAVGAERLAALKPRPNRELELGGHAIVELHRLLHLDRALERVWRPPEDRHQSVLYFLDAPPAIRRDGVSQQAEVRPAQLPGAFGIDVCETDQIGEEHGLRGGADRQRIFALALRGEPLATQQPFVEGPQPRAGRRPERP